ncbi:MAG TPA: CheR family methyltransferase [Pyrinomonadaceae bacterium]|jgi:chemotaxis protein methyltransferase CheR|nr:CheR family methyltransferase [Pyrinomonadaceae bacterium]
MESSQVSENLQQQVSECVAEAIGLHFPPARWSDLERGLIAAMGELGFTDLNSCAKWLLSARLTKPQLDLLSSHLTIGETYFFREKKTFEILAKRILPPLVHSRRSSGKRLRIWSAACCTGEEAYSLAILLHRVIPDLKDWFVSILATDINVGFLQKAVAGTYGEWSFREAPPWLKPHYFQRTEDGRYEILPEIKAQVTFAQINLVEDAIPSLVAETNAMDLIFCRNVLMYFSPAQASKVVRQLRRALVNDGWLVVSPSEASQTLFSQFETRNFPGVVLYQKSDARSRTEKQRAATFGGNIPAVFTSETESILPDIVTRICEFPEPTPALATDRMNPISSEPRPPFVAASGLYETARSAEPSETLQSSPDTDAPPDAKTFSLLTRVLADQGKLVDALAWCERWVNSEKLDARAHYVRAVILQELGETEQSSRSLRTAIYLDPGFVVAHFALGNVMRSRGKVAEAHKHFANASTLLRDYQPDHVLPESDGLTAARLSEIIASLVALEVVP